MTSQEVVADILEGSGGYVKIYRKSTKCKVLQEKSHVVSKFEAWIRILLRARGVDNGELKRGEFEVSYRFLAKEWRWSLSKTYRFMESLVAENMLKKVKHPAEHLAERFTICNYETYNPNRNAERNTQRNKYNKDKRKTIIKKLYSGEILERIPTKDGIEFEVTEELISEFKSAYPEVDILASIKKIRMWAIANPKKQWTMAGAMRGINSWLSGDSEKSKAQNLFAGLGNLGGMK